MCRLRVAGCGLRVKKVSKIIAPVTQRFEAEMLLSLAMTLQSPLRSKPSFKTGGLWLYPIDFGVGFGELDLDIIGRKWMCPQFFGGVFSTIEDVRVCIPNALGLETFVFTIDDPDLRKQWELETE